MVPAAIPQPGLRHGVTETYCVGETRRDDRRRATARAAQPISFGSPRGLRVPALPRQCPC